ncbi:hypothetical protein LSH36_534g01018 [Paralvinella palmiformis]|uniref:Gamma-soluble NSF attachment protein n=1 Tax=Paralvinella palmiformis TaxID=53620 RepID=A0AAD9J7G4_9ANNE|nr:hypothetical protein LSH36_534g01018 [Paralvinella palmiformis]
MASDKKILEGLEHVKQAEKCLKTGLFKWKPDFDGAAFEYSKAAVAFKNAKATDHAINSYLKCSAVQREMGSSLESAALILKEVKNADKAADFVEQAADLYLEHGTPDTAAIALDRAAKMIEQMAPERSIKMYMRACEICEGEDRPRECAEMIGKATNLLIRLRRLDEAANALKREMDYYESIENNGIINKLVMGLVLIHIHRQDYVAANLAYKAALNYTGFAESEEAGPIQQLLEAYDQGDPESANEVLRHPLFKYMENEFTKLSRDLVVHVANKTTTSGSSDGLHGSAAAGGGGDDDDEYADGLL